MSNQPPAIVPAPAPTAEVTVPNIPPPLIYEAHSRPNEPQQPDEIISPQMFLKYFNKSTNGTGSSVVVPVPPSGGQIPFAPNGFTPPPVNPGASQADYSTGK